MAEYTLLNGEHVYTKEAVDRQVTALNNALADEIAAQQSRDEEIEQSVAQETFRRESGDQQLDSRVSKLERYIGPDGIETEDGHQISIPDFYEEFKKECRDRKSEDRNIEEEFEKYLKFHGEQELNDKYEKLKNKPWIAYRDEKGRLQIKELLGNKAEPFDLTHIFTLTSFEQLGRKPWFVFKNAQGKVVCKELRGGKENALDLTEFAEVNDYEQLKNRPYFKYIDGEGVEHLVEIHGGPDNPVDLTDFAGASDYDNLQNKPYIKYKDGEGNIHTDKLEGGEDNALDLTDVSGGKSNYNELQHTFTINGLETKSDDPAVTKDVELNLELKQYPDSPHYDPSATYPADTTPVHVNEVELEAFTDTEIRQIVEDVSD